MSSPRPQADKASEDAMDVEEDAWTREARETKEKSQAILDSLAQDDSLYEQQNLSDWRCDIPGFINDMDTDPTWQGLDHGEFDPPLPIPAPKFPAKYPSSARDPLSRPSSAMSTASRSSYTAVPPLTMVPPSTVAAPTRQAPLPPSSRLPFPVPPPLSTYTTEQRQAMKAAVVDEHRPRPPTQVPQPGMPMPDFPTRGPLIKAEPNVDPTKTVNSPWAYIKGPSQYVTNVTAAEAAKAAQATKAAKVARAIGAAKDARAAHAAYVANAGLPPQAGFAPVRLDSRSAYVHHGRAEDAIFSDRAVDAITSAALGHPTFPFQLRRPIVNPVPNPPADKFLANNGPPPIVCPRPPHFDQAETGFAYSVSTFTKLADDKRKQEKAEEAEKARRERAANGGRILPVSAGRYWGYNERDEPEQFDQTNYGRTRFVQRPTPDHHPNMRGAHANTAFLPPSALNARATASVMNGTLQGPAPSETLDEIPMAHPPVGRGRANTVNPENLSARGSVKRAWGGNGPPSTSG